MRWPSTPSFHRKVSKCTVCRAAAMSFSSASKNAPFWTISTALPRLDMPSEMPASDGISSSSGVARLELQVRVLVPLDRPDGDAQQDDGEERARW